MLKNHDWSLKIITHLIFWKSGMEYKKIEQISIEWEYDKIGRIDYIW